MYNARTSVLGKQDILVCALSLEHMLTLMCCLFQTLLFQSPSHINHHECAGYPSTNNYLLQMALQLLPDAIIIFVNWVCWLSQYISHYLLAHTKALHSTLIIISVDWVHWLSQYISHYLLAHTKVHTSTLMANFMQDKADYKATRGRLRLQGTD